MKMTQDDALMEQVERLGRLDKRGTFTGAPRALTNPIFDEILSGESKNVVALIDRLKEVDNGDDWKVRYALHGIAQYLGGGKDKRRKEFGTAFCRRTVVTTPVPYRRSPRNRKASYCRAHSRRRYNVSARRAMFRTSPKQ